MVKSNFEFEIKYDLMFISLLKYEDLDKLLSNKDKIFIGLDKYNADGEVTTDYNINPTEFNSVGFCIDIDLDNMTINACMKSDAYLYSPDLYCITVHINSSNGYDNSVSLYLTRKYKNGKSIIDRKEAPKELYDKYLFSYLKFKPFRVITLLGSMRFINDFIDAQEILSITGNVVIIPTILKNKDKNSLSEQERLMLKKLIKQKINMADEVMVIDTDGYVSNGTLQEIDYAKNIGKKINYWSEYLKTKL